MDASRMQDRLQGLTLTNLNDKLQSMRDQLRMNVEHDLEYIKYKIEGDKKQPNSGHSSKYGELQNASNQEEVKEVSTPQEKQMSKQMSKPKSISALGDPQISNLDNECKNIELVEPKMDYDQIRRINAKKISAAYMIEYIKFVENQEVWEKIRQIFDQIMDIQEKVKLTDLFRRLNKLSIKFSQATTFEVPLIKRKITLKKVLFDIQYKYKKVPQIITWQDLQHLISQYRHFEDPDIEAIMEKESVKGKQFVRNWFNVPMQVITELKSFYRKCGNEYFFMFCSVDALIQKIQNSNFISKKGQLYVRPKSNYEIQYNVEDTLKYIKRKAPEYIDLDEFILYFTVKGFTYYPIEERYNYTGDSTLSEEPPTTSIARVKSDKNIKKGVRRGGATQFNQYFLSKNLVNSIRSKKVEEMIQIEQDKQKKQQKYIFKARPIPRSISLQRYSQFLFGIYLKKNQMKEINRKRKQSQQKVIQHLKNNTKLFQSPHVERPQQQKYQFISKPVPEIVLSPRLNKIEDQKTERRNKIMSQTKFKYHKSWQQLPQIAIALPKHCTRQNQNTPKPYKIPIKQIPDFKTQQQQLQYQIECRKHQFQPTEPIQFNFHTVNRHPHKDQQNIQEPHEYYNYRQILNAPEPDIYYTQKFTDMVVAGKKRVIEKEKSLNRQLQEEVERRKKHQNFAKFMKSNLAKLPDTNKICQNQAKQKIERHKKYWQNLDRQHEDRLNTIYSKILKRPFLYELQSSTSASKAIHRVISERSIAKPKKQKIKPPKKQKKKNIPANTDQQVVNRSF